MWIFAQSEESEMLRQCKNGLFTSDYLSYSFSSTVSASFLHSSNFFIFMTISIFTGRRKVIKFLLKFLFQGSKKLTWIMKIDFYHTMRSVLDDARLDCIISDFPRLPFFEQQQHSTHQSGIVVNEREKLWIFRTFEMKLLKIVWHGFESYQHSLGSSWISWRKIYVFCFFFPQLRIANSFSLAEEMSQQCNLIFRNLMHSPTSK